MDTRSPLHWSALLLGLFAASWMLVGLIGGLVFLIPLFAIAGFVLALVAARKLPEEATVVRAGATVGLIVYGLWTLLMLASQPVSIKNVGTHRPPAFLTETSEALVPFLPALGAIALAVTYWPIWRTVERALAGVGAALVIIIPFLPTPATADPGAAPLLMQIGFALGWLALLIAALLPVFKTDDAHPAWTGGGPAA